MIHFLYQNVYFLLFDQSKKQKIIQLLRVCCELAHTNNKRRELRIASCVVEIYCEKIAGKEQNKKKENIAKTKEKKN